TEGHTREFLDEVEMRDGLVKYNPILTWTEAEVWLYHALNEIPVHPLYAKGYRSLGCEPCSHISENSLEPERAGRWKGTPYEGGECGINVESLKP
ncbi:phosphoadenosine phosphosulfate reductase family protein, partial [Patescibacteria group bacterium]|nr:phosphoadenosine phosphosulfate reductase family protein [Patescibacteria group bacterium]